MGKANLPPGRIEPHPAPGTAPCVYCRTPFAPTTFHKAAWLVFVVGRGKSSRPLGAAGLGRADPRPACDACARRAARRFGYTFPAGMTTCDECGGQGGYYTAPNGDRHLSDPHREYNNWQRCGDCGGSGKVRGEP